MALRPINQAEPKHEWTQQEVLTIAVRAPADPKTVRKYLAGKQGKPSVAQRIERAMAELGFKRAS